MPVAGGVQWSTVAAREKDIVLSLVSPLPSVTSTVPVAGGVQWFTVAARAKQT